MARFDPFSFRTKFSALTVNSSLATLFGYVAKIVFFLGLILAISSSVFGVRERREEVAVFSIAGLQSSLFLLFGFEACLMQGTAFLLGGMLGIALLRLTLGNSHILMIGSESLAFVLLYLPITIVMTMIVPGQMVAKRKPSELLRSNV